MTYTCLEQALFAVAGGTILTKQCALFLCLAALSALGPGAGTLKAATLDDCFHYALAQSETLAESGESLFQAEEQYHQAIGAVLPSANLNFTYFRQDDHSFYINQTGQLGSTPAGQNRWTVTVAQPLFRGFAEYAALREAKDTVVLSRDATHWAAMQIYQDVAGAFYGVLSLERNRQLIADEVKLYDGRIKELRDFESIGRARNSDKETVQADQALLIATGVQVDEAIRVEREVLAFLTGKDANLKLRLTNQAPSEAGDLDALLQNLDSRPDIHAASMKNEAAKEFVRINKGAHLPSVDLLGHWYLDRPGSNSNIQWDAAISATLPLFEGFSLVSKDRQAESLQRQTQLDLERQRRQATSDIRSAWRTLSGDLSQIRAFDSAYRLADRAYVHLEQDYKNGLDTNQDVLIALKSSRDAQRSLETVRFAARNDYEQLETIAGRRLYLVP